MKPWMCLMAVALKLAGRNLIRHRRRSLIAVSSVSFGIVSLIIASGFTEWMFVDFREAMIASQYGHVQITRRGFHENGRSDPLAYLLPSDARTKEFESVAGIRALTPRLMLTGLISHGDATISFMGEGINPSKDMTGDRAMNLLAGTRLNSTANNEVLLGKGLAFLLGVEVGDDVVLMVNTPQGGINARDARVVGIFSSVSKAYDESALVVSVTAARSLLKVPGAHTWYVYLKDTQETNAVASVLRQMIDSTVYEVRTWDELAEFYNRAAALLREQLGVVRIIIVAIILLSICNTMMMSVMERTGEIGTAMALGVRRRALLAQILGEGAVIGIVGGFTGIILAILIANFIGALHIEMPPPPSMSRGYIANVLITAPIAIEALLIAVTTTIFASFYPAWKASRLEIVNALRHNR